MPLLSTGRGSKSSPERSARLNNASSLSLSQRCSSQNTNKLNLNQAHLAHNKNSQTPAFSSSFPDPFRPGPGSGLAPPRSSSPIPGRLSAARPPPSAPAARNAEPARGASPRRLLPTRGRGCSAAWSRSPSYPSGKRPARSSPARHALSSGGTALARGGRVFAPAALPPAAGTARCRDGRRAAESRAGRAGGSAAPSPKQEPKRGCFSRGKGSRGAASEQRGSPAGQQCSKFSAQHLPALTLTGCSGRKEEKGCVGMCGHPLERQGWGSAPCVFFPDALGRLPWEPEPGAIISQPCRDPGSAHAESPQSAVILLQSLLCPLKPTRRVLKKTLHIVTHLAALSKSPGDLLHPAWVSRRQKP